jgi:hypothetical protein
MSEDGNGDVIVGGRGTTTLLMSGTNSQDREEQGTQLNVWLKTIMAPYIVHGFASLTCILVFYWMFHFSNGFDFTKEKIFNFHPLFMSLAFILIIPESILLFRFSNGAFKRDSTQTLHATLHLFALFCAFFGFFCVFSFHSQNDISHFYSIHSWFGITVLVLLTIQYLYGIYLFYGAKLRIRMKFKPAHIRLGILICLLSTITVVSGINEKTLFTGICNSSITSACLTANFAGITSVISLVALLFALSYEGKLRSNYSRGGEGMDSATTSTDNALQEGLLYGSDAGAGGNRGTASSEQA